MRVLFVAGRHAYGDATRGEAYEHANMLPALRALGHEVELFELFDRRAHRDFAHLNEAFVAAVRRFAPDIVLCVLQLYELWTETLDLVRASNHAVLVNWGTDDSWKYWPFARYIAPHLDCYATTSAVALEAARRDGLANVVATQWAASDTLLARPLPASECALPVSFVGAAYGNRRAWIDGLRSAGVRVECFGNGWPNGPVASGELSRIVRDSVISLNFADSGLHLRGVLPYRSRQLKARVFEVPGAGGFLLTEASAELARYYDLEREVATFTSAGELAARIRHFLAHPTERDRIAQAGHERTRREHTYGARLAALVDSALALRSRPAELLAEPEADRRLRACVEAHLAPGWLSGLRGALVRPLSLVFGERRGARAARRLVYELSWRLAGARTYGARGWPGRLFYAET